MAGNTTLPQGIEIFREGTHVDDAGVPHAYSAADIDAMAAAYDPALHDAPLTVGHPATDEPRYGHVAALQAVDNAAGQRTLVMTAADVQPAFAEAVTDRRFPKRSTAFYSPAHPQNPKPGSWYVRHVGFLGAQPPAVKGLADLPRTQFADEGAGLVCFSEPAPTQPRKDTMDEKDLQAQLDAEKAARAEADKRAKEADDRYAAQLKAQRDAQHAEHVQFAEAQLKAGRLTKPEVPELVAALDQAAAAEVVQFGEGSDKKPLAPVALIKRLVERAAPLANLGGNAGGAAVQFGEGGEGGARGKSDAEIDAAAKAYAAKHNVSYGEALNRVVSFTA
ncbi:MAG: hypothetical protein IAE86_06820 [Burkholderiaceae bacterium]|nr:hypothetical protein [Burkholderiaceae bacterium]